MQRNLWLVLSAAVLSAAVVIATGCEKKPAMVGGKAACCGSCGSAMAAEGEKKAGHEAHHGGCLNAIETCAVGHAEIKIDGKTLRLWLVGGENETGKSVRTADPTFDLKITADGGKTWSLSLQAKPLDLAGEKPGDCSHFEANADWLDGLKKFHAEGAVNFKGKKRPVKIDYPEGYDPD